MAKKRGEDLSLIPICTSDFLSTVSIELGRRMKGLRYQARAGELEFRVKKEDVGGLDIERFDAIYWGWKNGEYFQVIVWEDYEVLYVHREPFRNRHDKARYTRCRARLHGWTAFAVAGLINDSLRDENEIRDVWKKLSLKK